MNKQFILNKNTVLEDLLVFISSSVTSFEFNLKITYKLLEEEYYIKNYYVTKYMIYVCKFDKFNDAVLIVTK